MPVIQTIQGNLISEFKKDRYWAIAHGANCQNTMKSGIAKQLVKAFPEVSHMDSVVHAAGKAQLGFAFPVFVTAGHGIVYNLYTQYYPGYDNPAWKDSKQDRLDAIEKCFADVNIAYNLVKHSNIFGESKLMGIPKIGAGLAGGNWDDILEVINRSTPDVIIELVEYNEE
jgi:O-acetyl-ADP-ribose deacetylase (regulator of RNase III)